MPRSNNFWKSALAVSLGLLPLTSVWAQEPTSPPPLSPEKTRERGERGLRGSGEFGPRGPGGPGAPVPGSGFGESRGGGRGPDRGDFFRQLSEEERKKVREAFDKVWVRPEVEAARNRLREANDDYRRVIQEALQAVDPEVVRLLDKARPKPQPWPEPGDPDFDKKILERLRMEGPYGWGGRGEEIHRRIVELPKVAELIKRLREASPEQRKGAVDELREAYHRAMRELGRPGGEEGRRGEGRERDRNRPPEGN